MDCCTSLPPPPATEQPPEGLGRRAAVQGLAGSVALAGLAAAGAARAQDAAGTRLRLAFCGQLLCVVPYEVAKSRGHFRAEGLEVELVYTRGGNQAMQALVGGAVDYAGTSFDVALQAFANGAPIRRFASTGRLPLFALATSPSKAGEIRDIKALEGRSIGVSGLGNADHILVLHLMKRAGVDPSRSRFAAIGTNLFEALRRGQVEAGMVQEPALTLLQEAGGRVIFNAMDIGDANRVLGGAFEFMGVAVRAAERDRRLEEMRRLATRVERWVKSRLGEAIGLEFNKLGSGRGGSGAPEEGEQPTEKDLWDRIWSVFTGIVGEAEGRFAERAKSFDASDDEAEVGMWRLRRKSWVGLREKIEEEVMEGNILLKLRENFEDKFRYDEAGVPRIWSPSDDIEGIYTKARESTLTLIPLLSRFRLSKTYAPPNLPGFIGPQPGGVEVGDEEDLTPIGGVDEEEGKSLEEEMTVLSESKRQDLVVRFKKTADGVYVEAKRSAIGGVAQVPWYFYGLLLALGWNEIFMGMRLPPRRLSRLLTDEMV